MTKVCVDDLTVGQVKELARFAGTTPNEAHPYVLGKNYFIRCVTHYYTGRLVRVTAQELVLENAAWIADTGCFAQAMETGNFSEVEPYPAQELILGRGAVVDAVQVSWTLPKKQT